LVCFGPHTRPGHRFDYADGDSTDTSARGRTSQSGRQPSSGDHRADAGDGEHAEAGKETGAAPYCGPNSRTSADSTGSVTDSITVGGWAQPVSASGVGNDADGVVCKLAFEVAYSSDCVVMVVV